MYVPASSPSIGNHSTNCYICIPMDYLLHIDTSTDTGTVAIGGDGKLLALRSNTETRNHASTINILISEVLADANITFKQLAAVAVCAGPGSYTGLRIGMATAKGLCYALNIPLLLDNRLTLLAYNAFRQNKNVSQYVSLLLARQHEYFISIYDINFECTLPAQHVMESQLRELVENKDNFIVITDVPDIINLLDIITLQIDTATQINFDLWVFYSIEKFKCNNIVNLMTAEPFYLKQVYTITK